MSAATVSPDAAVSEQVTLTGDAAQLLDLVTVLAARLGYRTDLRRLPAALADHPAGVATWLATGARYATVITLIGLGDLASGQPDLLHIAGLASISGSQDRYAATAATVFGEACDNLSGSGLLRYAPASQP